MRVPNISRISKLRLSLVLRMIRHWPEKLMTGFITSGSTTYHSVFFGCLLFPFPQSAWPFPICFVCMRPGNCALTGHSTTGL